MNSYDNNALLLVQFRAKARFEPFRCDHLHTAILQYKHSLKLVTVDKFAKQQGARIFFSLSANLFLEL